jgi:hypothetical protein
MQNEIKKSFIEVYVTPILVGIGLMLNLMTIMVFSRVKMRKYCLSISMICLAVSDTAVLTIPVLLTWIDDIFYDLYYMNNTIWCNLHGYVDMIACANSSWIIVVISIERWFAVVKPWQKSRVFTNKRVGIAILCLFLASIVLFSYFPFSMALAENKNYRNYSDKSDEQFKYECGIKKNFEKIYEYLGFVSIILIYFLPFITLAILNAMILHRLRVSPFSNKQLTLTRHKSFKRSNNSCKQKKKSEKNTASNLEKNSVTQSVVTTQSQPVSNCKNDRSLSVTLLTVSVTFMILTFPFQIHWMANNIKLFKSNAISNLTDFVEMPRDYQAFYYHLQFLMFFIKNMNYVINFFLYSALSTLFRQEFLAIFKESKLLTFFKCTKCFRYKQVITEAKFSKKSESCSEIVFPVNSGNQRQKKFLKIRIESTNLGKFFSSKKKIIKDFEENQPNNVQRQITSAPILEQEHEQEHEHVDELPLKQSSNQFFKDTRKETRRESSPKTMIVKQYNPNTKRNSIQIPLQSFKQISTAF